MNINKTTIIDNMFSCTVCDMNWFGDSAMILAKKHSRSYGHKTEGDKITHIEFDPEIICPLPQD